MSVLGRLRQEYRGFKASLSYTARPCVKRPYEEARNRWLTPVILTTWEAEIGRIILRGQSWQIVIKTPISKITSAKWTGGVAQVVDHLLCNCEASSTKNKRMTGGWGGGEREREKERREKSSKLD
jgi:hypothetical protein